MGQVFPHDYLGQTGSGPTTPVRFRSRELSCNSRFAALCDSPRVLEICQDFAISGVVVFVRFSALEERESACRD